MGRLAAPGFVSVMLYIHVPYCKQACSYCDFYFTTRQATLPRFASALLTELGLSADFPISGPFSSVYFGGGTPSLLSTADFAQILGAVNEIWGLEPGAEISVEANPDDLNPEYLASLRAAGANRLSIGIQTFDADILKALNRAHTAEQAQQAVHQARAAGFDRISIDLMYQLPGLTRKGWQATLTQAVALQPEHISAYGLTIEPQTLLAHQVRTGAITSPPDEVFLEQFALLVETLQNAGYEHYETSNFAQPGHRAVHNSSYWEGKPYLALGPGAHGYDGRRRYLNEPNLHAWLEALEANRLPPRTWETLTEREQLNEYLLTRLRTSDGLDTRWLAANFTPSLLQPLLIQLEQFQEQGFLVPSPRGLAIAPAHRTLTDHLTEQLFQI